MSQADLTRILEDLSRTGRQVRFWLRDDDAVEPTRPLDRLLDLARSFAVPLTLAVIPQHTGRELAERVDKHDDITVAVHGWSHINHAGPGEKKQELGAHRPLDRVANELLAGFDKLSALYPEAFIPMLVPPWNRISPDLVGALPALGFRALSVFGRETPASLALLNTHVDIMNWHGVRGGREPDVVFRELAELLASPDCPEVVGILTHHLVHDENAWGFLERLFAATAGHAACRWTSARTVPGF
ncbi:polysaccharide deacetylase [Rhizobium deserti]|uniref:Polysaccharide deacetylase n=1 Tax=Rhizobium deserti TaxID=2547961 RepID=A0A4R5UKG0_9HYPH|nr:polysaccharide deacetylase family protein [Rhizobium deserti]TDK37388.1 polysaccharide deacetylase [Rhizobium deserti]